MSDAKKTAEQSSAKNALAKTKSTENKNSKTGTPETVMYIGPLIRGVASPNSIYKNGIPPALKKKVDEMPIIKAFIVPISDLAGAKKDITDETTALGSQYKKLVSMLKE